jgi:dsRNA-specific ribonuclease
MAMLGDAVLEIVITDYLLKTQTEKSVPEIFNIKMKIVDSMNIYCGMQNLNLCDYILYDSKIRHIGKKECVGMLKAIIGGYYMWLDEQKEYNKNEIIQNWLMKNFNFIDIINNKINSLCNTSVYQPSDSTQLDYTTLLNTIYQKNKFGPLNPIVLQQRVKDTDTDAFVPWEIGILCPEKLRGKCRYNYIGIGTHNVKNIAMRIASKQAIEVLKEFGYN